MKTIALIISVVVIPVIFMATIVNQIPKKVECEGEGKKVECEGEVLRPVTVRKEYLDFH